MIVREKELRNLIIQRLRRRAASARDLVKYVAEKLGVSPDESLRKKVMKILREEKERGRLKRCEVSVEQKSRLKTPYKRSVLGWVYVKREKEKVSISYDARVHHTRDLQQMVIKPWIEQLPTVSIRGIFFATPWSSLRFEKDSKLEVEGHDLFPDLKNHLCFEPNPFGRLELFKQGVREFWDKREKMLAKIDMLLKKRIGLPVSDKWEYGNAIHRNLSEKILQSAFYWADGRNRAFDQELNFKSEMKPVGNFLEYWIGAYGCIKVSRRKKEEEALKEEFDRKVREIIEEMKKPEYVVEAREIVKIIHKLEKLKEEMKSVLTKHLRMPVLPGDCEILLRVAGL